MKNINQKAFNAVSSVLLLMGLSTATLADRIPTPKEIRGQLQGEGHDDLNPNHSDSAYGLDSPNTPSPSSYTDVITLPQGTNLFRFRSDSACLNFKNALTPYNVFGSSTGTVDQGDLEFTTGPASSVVAIRYTGTASIAGTVANNALRVKCSYSQEGGTWSGPFTPCSALGGSGATTVRTVASGTASPNTSISSFIGIANGLSANTVTRVRITAQQDLATTANSTICHSNLNVSY